jgi:anti-anti-sigma factor
MRLMRESGTTSDLTISAQASGDNTVVSLIGRVNVETSPLLRDRLRSILQADSTKAIIVDLTQVPYVDASGIATLIEALKIARSRGATLCLKGLQGRLLHLFEVAGISALFETVGCGSPSAEWKVS